MSFQKQCNKNIVKALRWFDYLSVCKLMLLVLPYSIQEFEPFQFVSISLTSTIVYKDQSFSKLAQSLSWGQGTEEVSKMYLIIRGRYTVYEALPFDVCCQAL